MPVKAITPDYRSEVRDNRERFGPNQLLNICWEKHTMLGWPMCVPLPPETPFGALIEKVLPSIFGFHPDFAKIDWSAVQWSTAKGPFTPDPTKSIAEHGFKHKTQIRFRTPGLDGHNGAG
jgi:phenol hydroxylase P4 protein